MVLRGLDRVISLLSVCFNPLLVAGMVAPRTQVTLSILHITAEANVDIYIAMVKM